jgi:Txe/YoeB family toxin of Txe-Axe toxin-antitoxin module
MENPRQWAKDNLSPARYRAFLDALSGLEQKKLSNDHWEARRNLDQIERAHVVANAEEIHAIREKAEKRAREIESLIQSLSNEARAIRDDATHKVDLIRARVYESEEWKEQNEKRSKIWQRDDALFQPKVQELIEKYQKAQEKANA